MMIEQNHKVVPKMQSTTSQKMKVILLTYYTTSKEIVEWHSITLINSKQLGTTLTCTAPRKKGGIGPKKMAKFF